MVLKLVTDSPKPSRKSPAIKPERVWRVGGTVYPTYAAALKAAVHLRKAREIDTLAATIAQAVLGHDVAGNVVGDILDAIALNFTVKSKARKS